MASNSSETINYICDDDCKGIKAYVKIYYGPYVAWGILRHRTQRLQHLIEALEVMGHTTELIPIKLWDRVEINIFERTIHRFRLTDLEINPTSIKENPACYQAIIAVAQTLREMKNANIKEGLIYERI